MKTVRTYQNINDALLEQSWLESNGIESLIPDEVTASSALPHLSVYSGIRLQVKEEDFEAALKLLPDEPSPASKEQEIENERKPSSEPITLGFFKAVIVADFAIYILTIFLNFIHLSKTPESILRYAGDQYISYPLALLSYYSFWPLLALSIVASIGLFCRKSWARVIYVFVWVFGLSAVLFSSAFFLYPSEAFLGGISTLLGGFICCMIYFTNAARFFRNKGVTETE